MRPIVKSLHSTDVHPASDSHAIGPKTPGWRSATHGRPNAQFMFPRQTP